MPARPVPLSPPDAPSSGDSRANSAALIEELAEIDALLATQQQILATLREDGSWSEPAAQDVIRTCLSTMESAEDRRRVVLSALAAIDLD